MSYRFELSFDSGNLSDSQKLSYITLICKDPSNSTECKNYRPISLLSIDRKVLSKILATRLRNVLLSVIGISQTCAIKGYNVHLMRNVFDDVEQKDIGAAFISLDLEKAFNHVSWTYMVSALKSSLNGYSYYITMFLPLLLLTIIFRHPLNYKEE